MADKNITLANTESDAFDKGRRDLYGGLDALRPKYLALTNKAAHLNTLANWDFNTAAPTVARENALFALALFLLMAVGYLASRVGIKRPA